MGEKQRVNTRIDEKQEHQANATEGTKLEEIKVMLLALMGETDAGGSDPTKSCVWNKGGIADNMKTERFMTEKQGVRTGKDRALVIEYMRCRMDYCMTLNYKEIKVMCKKRNACCDHKDKGAWELAKQDTDQFSKLVNNIEDEEENEGEEDSTDDEDCHSVGAEENNVEEVGDVSGN
ncbi:hypothetical protein CBR_g10823 [Chara braunii]|uniref:Uncharacterized protein n=1 Tax=Chara braunii TaxID=69332 RepID=A0A388KPB0_CHABU|nr:hypothetical protein CBR_g10823 [Chara braunii]|eukprot:GBG71886.1 hypothetical protein CBR_g10823 [Chara braunii]